MSQGSDVLKCTKTALAALNKGINAIKMGCLYFWSRLCSLQEVCVGSILGPFSCCASAKGENTDKCCLVASEYRHMLKYE